MRTTSFPFHPCPTASSSGSRGSRGSRVCVWVALRHIRMEEEEEEEEGVNGPSKTSVIATLPEFAIAEPQLRGRSFLPPGQQPSSRLGSPGAGVFPQVRRVPLPPAPPAADCPCCSWLLLLLLPCSAGGPARQHGYVTLGAGSIVAVRTQGLRTGLSAQPAFPAKRWLAHAPWLNLVEGWVWGRGCAWVSMAGGGLREKGMLNHALLCASLVAAHSGSTWLKKLAEATPTETATQRQLNAAGHGLMTEAAAHDRSI